MSAATNKYYNLLQEYSALPKPFLALAFGLIVLGLVGLLGTKTNIILIMISLELILLSVSFLFATSAIAIDDATGSTAFVALLTLAAAEAAVGLGIFVTYHRIQAAHGLSVLPYIKT